MGRAIDHGGRARRRQNDALFVIDDHIHATALDAGPRSLFSDVSIIARPFFERWGFAVEKQSVGVHVNAPNGYVSAGLAAHLDVAARAETAVDLRNRNDIEPKLRAHIARGVDVIKIATTHGDIGFHDARPDLLESWVREIVRIAHGSGLRVTVHSYGDKGDWAAIRGGVDGIEHLVNVSHDLRDEMIREI